MATPPSQGKTLVLKLDPSTMKFGVVVQNFEGEANPAVMKLDMQTWTWIQTTRTDGAPVVPKKKKFTITFKTDNTFSATTDCNGVGGEYTAKEDSITFSKMMSTLMFCEDSQEAEFSQMLSDARAYLFTTRGELVLRLADGASMTFK
jgi:heat shock protein HslJ